MSHCAPTLTLTFVRTVDSRGAPRLLVIAGAAAIAQLAAGVVLALTLESGQKKDTWSWQVHLCSTRHGWLLLSLLANTINCLFYGFYVLLLGISK